jgi:hypothetical protein
MRHEEKYCIWSGSSIGGCPLEEASEQERIPSIIGSIVWCCPTSRVFSISCVHVMVNGLWFILGIIEVYLQIWYRYLTSGIRALSLGIQLWATIFYFCRFFFSEKKKEGRDIPDIFSIFMCKICRKGLYI